MTDKALVVTAADGSGKSEGAIQGYSKRNSEREKREKNRKRKIEKKEEENISSGRGRWFIESKQKYNFFFIYKKLFLLSFCY